MPPRNRWLELLLIGVARVAMGVQFQAVGALGPLLVGTLVADWTALGTLIGIYSLAGVAVALPAGWLLARFGDRRILLAGLALMTAGGVMLALAPGYGLALLGRLVAGGGSALLTIACAKRVLDRFAGPSLAPAMGVMLSAWPVGISVALMALPLAGEDYRLGLLGSALLCGLALPLLAWAVPEGQRGPAARMARLRPGEGWPLLAVGALWATYNAAYAVLLGFAPAFLVAQGASAGMAGAVSSLVGWAILPLLPLGGAIAERLGRPMLVCALCQAGMVAALLALVAGVPAAPALIAFGLLAGLLRDVTGAPAAPILAAAGFLALALGALGALAAMLRRAVRETR